MVMYLMLKITFHDDQECWSRCVSFRHVQLVVLDGICAVMTSSHFSWIPHPSDPWAVRTMQRQLEKEPLGMFKLSMRPILTPFPLRPTWKGRCFKSVERVTVPLTWWSTDPGWCFQVCSRSPRRRKGSQRRHWDLERWWRTQLEDPTAV